MPILEFSCLAKGKNVSIPTVCNPVSEGFLPGFDQTSFSWIVLTRLVLLTKEPHARRAPDADDNPHVSYHDNSPSDLKYEYYQPENSGDPASCTAMVCNADGQILSGYPLFVIPAIGTDYYFALSFDPVFENYSGHSFAEGMTPVTVGCE